MWQVKESSYNIINLGECVIVLKDIRAIVKTPAGVKVLFTDGQYLEVKREGDKRDETFGELWNALTNKDSGAG